MNKYMLRVVFCILALHSLATCKILGNSDLNIASLDGGMADAGDKSKAVLIDASLYCEEISSFFCDFYLRCGRIAVDDTDACLHEFKIGCEGFYEPRYEDLVEQDLLHLSGDGLKACRDYLSKAACSDVFYETAGACAGMWVGHQEIGEQCSVGLESKVCVPGAQCVVTQNGCGTCMLEVSTGELCNGDSLQRCDSSNFCLKNDGADIRVCHKRKKIDESCVNNISECMTGSFCNANRVCQQIKFVKLGDPCNFEQRCPYKSKCVEKICIIQPTSGESCTEDVSCNKSYCDEGKCRDLKAETLSCENSFECLSGICGPDQKCTALTSGCYE